MNCILRYQSGRVWGISITIGVANVVVQTDGPFNPVAVHIFDLHSEHGDAVVDLDAPVAGGVVEGTHFEGWFGSGRGYGG